MKAEKVYLCIFNLLSKEKEFRNMKAQEIETILCFCQ